METVKRGAGVLTRTRRNRPVKAHFSFRTISYATPQLSAELTDLGSNDYAALVDLRTHTTTRRNRIMEYPAAVAEGLRHSRGRLARRLLPVKRSFPIDICVSTPREAL